MSLLLTQFGANLVILQRGALSSLRHWHLNEDEFAMITQGECVMAQDASEELMRVGGCAAFPAGSTDSHHFINRTDPRVEMADGKARFNHKDSSDWDGPR